MLTVAGLINAFGVSVFLYPVNLYDSGISGTAMLLAQITPDWCSLSLILLLLNVPLFLFGLKRQGVQFTIYAVYSVFIYSLGAWLIQGPLPLDVSISSPLAGTDLLLCALFGGLISGVGSGLAIRGGGAMDGMEVMAVIFARKLGMTVGTFVMSYNVVLYILAGLLRSSWILPLYSIIAYAVGLKVVDFVIEGIDRSKAALIVTRNPDAICRALGEAFGTGMTCIPAQGGFSHEEMTIVYFVVNRFQISRMKDIVHDLDDRAYITISEVADVFKLNQDKLSQKVDNQPLLPRRILTVCPSVAMTRLMMGSSKTFVTTTTVPCSMSCPRFVTTTFSPSTKFGSIDLPVTVTTRNRNVNTRMTATSAKTISSSHSYMERTPLDAVLMFFSMQLSPISVFTVY